MPTRSTRCFLRSFKRTLIVIAMTISLIGAWFGCAELKTRESKGSTPASFSLYVLSRGKGVPDEARRVLDHARQVLKEGQEQGEVIRLLDRRIGLEGETRLCAEFSDEQVADRFFNQIYRFSLGVDLVNMKKETCPP